MTGLKNFSTWVSTMIVLFIFLLVALASIFGEMSFSSLFLEDFVLLNIEFLFSPFSMSFFFFVTLISVLVFSWGRFYMASGFKMCFFYTTLLGFVSSMLLLVMSGNLFSLFLGWEGLGVTSFILIVFYQNWMSMKGGLLTILTNRLGDGMLLVSTCYWLFSGSFGFFLGSGVILVFFVSLIAFTKSAQWPFVSWLPAAMAAPTPVSALVHSSTLVTAGIWLILRMSQLTILNFKSWFFLGLITLVVASTAALLETDAKKVVALSTLSQLGLMFVSISMGNFSMCLFHVLTHALAKSNLFLVVGSVLYNRFAQQDSRSLSSMSTWILILSAMISVFSLVGMMFMSSFFSKEQILLGHYMMASSLFSFLILLSLSSMTVAYCLKLVLVICNLSLLSCLFSNNFSKMMNFPMVFLSFGTMVIGYFFFKNFGKMMAPVSSSVSSLYWSLLLLGLVLMKISNLSKIMMTLLFSGFLLQLSIIEAMKLFFMNFKSTGVLVEGTVLENFYLLMSLSLSYFFNFFVKLITLLGLVTVLVIFF